MVELRGASYFDDSERGELSPLASLGTDLPAKTGRVRACEEPPQAERPRFQLDRDRILYSSSFRKLQYKTQVFVTHEGDLYRTRMTHTIEVMQISRSLARMLGLNETLAEAIALVHDIGHPPFGHGGETALDALMKDSGGFDHNLHGLRVVDWLERCYPAFRGLNLCWETREGLARHRTLFDEPPVLEEFSAYAQPSAECQVVNVADTIAWCTHDLDDALRIGLVSADWLGERASEMPLIAQVARVMVDSIEDPGWDLGASRTDVGRMRAISGMINALITDVARETAGRMSRAGVETPEALRELPDPLVSFSPGIDSQVHAFALAMLEEVYLNPIVSRMIFKGEKILGGLYETFTSKPDMLPAPLVEDLESEPAERVVCDYLAGMTDRYAMDLYGMLYQPNVRTTDWF
ncbi:MAG: dNTP triphosphohydrolase [Actinomycetota bacterium]